MLFLLSVKKKRWWWSIICKLNTPLKIRLFFWLALSNNILAWESLQRRALKGPGMCILCKNSFEEVHHLLVSCPFTQAAWDATISYLEENSHGQGNPSGMPSKVGWSMQR
jgi:hypothetical protein